jgi:hypothetical protein
MSRGLLNMASPYARSSPYFVPSFASIWISAVIEGLTHCPVL